MIICMKQTLQTIVLGGSLIAVALLTGWQLLGGWTIVILVSFLVALGISLAGRSTPIQIRGARELDYRTAPDLVSMVESISRSAGLAGAPRLHYVPNATMNAATVGSGEHTSIVVTGGLLGSLNRRELEGVIAHEIAHVRNNDLALFRFADTLRRATTLFTRAGWFLLIFAFPVLLSRGSFSPLAILALLAAPLLSWLLELALLRTREFAADKTAAELTGDPDGLASALLKIDYRQRSFFGILFPVNREAENTLFRTHPPTADRVERLRSMRRGARRVSPVDRLTREVNIRAI